MLAKRFRLRIRGFIIEFDGIAIDLEGTIIKILERPHHVAFKYLANLLGVQMNLDAWRTYVIDFPHLLGGPPEEIVREIFAKSPLPKEELPSIQRAREIEREVFRRLRSEISRLPMRSGFTNFMRQVIANDIPHAIGSYTEREDAKKYLTMSGAGAFFDPKQVVLRGDVERIKPHPDVWWKTAELMGVRSEDQLVIGDSMMDLLSGHAAGATVCIIPIHNHQGIRQWFEEKGRKIGAKLVVAKSWRDLEFIPIN